MAQQITNNSLIQDSLLANTSFADSSANQFDSILDIANKSVLKQNTNNTDTTITDKTSLSLNQNSTASTNQTNTADFGNVNTKTVQSVNNSSTTNLKQTDTTKSTPTVDTAASQTNTTNVAVQEVIQPAIKDTVLNVDDTEQMTDIGVDDEILSDEELTNQVETLIQTYAMNKIDLSAIKLHFPDELEITETDIDSATIDNIELEVDNIIDETASDIETDVDENINVDKHLDVDVDIDLNIVEDINVNTEVNNEIKTDLVNTQDVINTSFITPVSIDLNLESDVTLPVDTNSIMMKVSNEVESLQESYFLPKEKTVDTILTQDMIDELNVTVEDLNVADVQNEETVFDSPLMDSTEQAVKYSMEQVEKEPRLDTINVKNSYNDDKEVNISYEKTIETGIAEVDNEELVDTKREIIKDSGKDVTLDDVEKTDEIVSEDIDYSFSEDGFNSESETDSNVEAVVKPSEKENLKDTKKEYVEAETVHEEPVATDKVTSDMISGAENHLGIKGVHSSTTASASTQTFASANVSKEDIIAQIHTKLQSMNSHSNTKLTMVLNPESLGKVTIQLANTKNGMVAEMVVASQNVKEILDSNISGLKDTLTAQGVQVNEVSVKVSESENNAEMDYTEQDSSESGKGEQGKQQRQKEQDENKFEKMVSDLEEKNKN